MSHEPDVHGPADVLPWIHAHRARSHALWQQQERENRRVSDRQCRLESRLSNLERAVARWSAVSALLGGGIGAAVVQLVRFWIGSGGGSP